MPEAAPLYFFQTLYQLRSREELILYGQVLQITPEEAADVTAFLEAEYGNECLGYPGTPPAFDPDAALWAARTVYYAAQLLLFRQSAGDAMQMLLPPYAGNSTPAAVLSADLCLRFLPQVLENARHIDPEDALIPLLASLLHPWPYSAIGSGLLPEAAGLAPILEDDCLRQLYADRVIAAKELTLARLPAVYPLVKGSLGDYTAYYWKQLIEETP